MNYKPLVAEFVGTFMLMASVLGAAFYSFTAPTGAAGILGVALSIGLTVMALTLSIGPISGAHYNPAVTLGLAAAGRFHLGDAVLYIAAQCLGAIAATAVFAIIGHAPASYFANGFGAQSMIKAGLAGVFLIEMLLTAFLLVVVMGATRRDAPAGLAAPAIGLALAAAYLIAIPVSGASVNPARSLGSAVFAGTTALGQLWVFWVAPIIGGVLGALLYNWLEDEA